MRKLRKIAVRLALALGWISLFSFTALFVVDQSGLARHWLVSALEAALGELGETLEVQHVRFDWLEPGVELHGLQLGEGQELVSIERLHATLGLTSDGRLGLSRLEIDRGRLRVGARLGEALASILEAEAEELPEAARGDGAIGGLPSVQVRGLEIEWELAEGAHVALGAVDLTVDPGSQRDGRPARPLARGRVVLPATRAAERPAVLHLEGRQGAGEWIELTASAAGLALEALALPELAELEALRDLSVTGLVDVAFHGRIGGLAPLTVRGDLRLRARDGGLLPGAGRPPVREIALDVSTALDAREGRPLLSREAWKGGARFAGRWHGFDVRGGARLGGAARPGALLEGWTRTPRAWLTEELVGWVGRPLFLDNLHQALRPDGDFDLTLGVRIGDGWGATEPLARHLELCAEILDVGQLHGSWFGIPPEPGLPRVAFPMRARTLDLRASYAHNPRFSRPDLIGVRWEGEHQGDRVGVSFYSWSPPVDLAPFTNAPFRSEEEIYVRSPGVTVDEDLRVALDGLSEIPALDGLWEKYGPAGGRIAVDLRLARRLAIGKKLAGRVNLRLIDCGATWSELPVQAQGVQGEIEYISNGRGDEAVRIALEGWSRDAERLVLRGRLREEALLRDVPVPALETFEIDVGGISVTGSDREVVAGKIEGVGVALGAFEPRGRVDVRYRQARSAPGAPVETSLEVEPTDTLEFQPPSFPLRASGVRGRVLASGSAARAGDGEPTGPGLVVSVSPLVGDWVGGARVAIQGRFPVGADGHIALKGAGLSLDDAEFQRQMLAAAAVNEGVPRPLAESELARIRGDVDFTSEIVLPLAEEEVSTRHRFLLRRNDLDLGDGRGLRDLRGTIEFDGRNLTSEELSLVLGSSRLFFEGTRATIEDEGVRLSTRLQAQGVPLDREHLRYFVEPAALERLIQELEWRGRVDAHGWDIEWGNDLPGGQQISVRGELTATDVFLNAALPLAIGSCSGRIDELTIEEGELRFVGELEDVYGQLVGRDFGPARALISVFGSRFTIDTLEGNFARGTLRRPDSGPTDDDRPVRPGPSFALNAEPPYPFQVALELEGADVGLMLGGLFPENIANRGRFSCELRLHGEMDDVLSIRGDGHGVIQDSRLWSIPVFRDLFSQLGFEETAVFDSMHTDLRIEDGVIRMDDIEVKSPILKLRGRGTLDFDGTLHHDLQVHYSVVDQLQVVRQIFYLLQNSLLYVSIRGDMWQPIVILRGALSRVIQPLGESKRTLPVPGYSELPARF